MDHPHTFATAFCDDGQRNNTDLVFSLSRVKHPILVTTQMSYLYNTSDNGSPSFSRVSLSSLRSRKTDAELLERAPSNTSTLRGRRGRADDLDEELTYIPGSMLLDGLEAEESVHNSTIARGASRLSTTRSPPPPLSLSTSRTSGAPLFASRASRRRLIPEDEESTQEEDTILPANAYNRTFDTVQLEQFSDLSVVHQLQSDPRQISRISAKANSLRNRTASISHQQEQTYPSPPSEAGDFESSQITVVPTSFGNPAASISHQQQFQSPPSPTAELPGLESISRITAVPTSFRNRIGSTSQQQRNPPPPSPTDEIPYSPGFEKRLVEEADRENAHLKFSTFRRPGVTVEDSSFDADNLPSFNFSSPIASSTPRAPSKSLGKVSKSRLFDQSTVLTIDQYQDEDDDDDGGGTDITVLPANPMFAPQREAERPESRDSAGTTSESDNMSNILRRKERRERRRRRENVLDPIREMSGGSSYLRAHEREQAAKDEKQPGIQLSQLKSEVRTQQQEEVAASGGSDSERRNRIWSTLGNRANLNRRKRDTSHSRFSTRTTEEPSGDETVLPANKSTETAKKVVLQEEPTESLDWLKLANFATPQVRTTKTGIFATTQRARPNTGPEVGGNEASVPGPSSRRIFLSPARDNDKTDLFSPGKISLFSTTMNNIPEPSYARTPVKNPSKSTPEPLTPRVPPVTAEEESTADVTKEMEIVGTPVVVVRRSRRNRENTQSPEDIAASESEVRDALKAYSRQASASPSSDYNQREEADEPIIRDKGKGREEGLSRARSDGNKENTRPWGKTATNSGALFESRYEVAEKLSGVGAPKPISFFHTNVGAAGEAKGTTQGVEGPSAASAPQNGPANGSDQTARERLRSPTRRTFAVLVSPKSERPQAPDPVTTSSPRRALRDLDSLRASLRLPRRENASGQMPATIRPIDIATGDAVVASSGEQLPTARHSAVAAALRRARESTSSSQPKQPPPRPSTPESRKQKAHLYGDKTLLESPGSDYDFLGDARVEQEFLPPRLVHSTRPTEVQRPSQPVQPRQPAEVSGPSQPVKPVQPVQAAQSSESTQLKQSLKPTEPAKPVQPPTQAEAAPQPRRSIKDLLFGWSNTPAKPIQPSQAQKSSRPPAAPSSSESKPPAPSIQAPKQVPKATSETALPSTRTTKSTSSSAPQPSSSNKKGKERAIPIDDPTQDSTHETIANDNNDFASLLYPSASSSEHDSEQKITDPRPLHQRVPREPGDSEIEANPRFIVRLKEAEMAMLSKMNNKLQTLQTELRSTKRGIEILEKKLVGTGAGAGAGTGTDSERSSATGTDSNTTEEWTEEEREALRAAAEELSEVEARKLAAERAGRKRARRRGGEWTTAQKWGLAAALLLTVGLTCLLLEVLMLLVSVRVPCRSETEFTDEVCNLRSLPGLGLRYPVDVGDGLRYLPLESPLLGLLYSMTKVPGIILHRAFRIMKGIGGVPGWIAAWIGWVGTGLWRAFMGGLGQIGRLIVAGASGIWWVIKAWGGIVASMALWVFRIVWMVLSTMWAVISWGTKFNPSPPLAPLGSSSLGIPTSTFITPSIPNVSVRGPAGTASGSMGEDDSVATVVVDAGQETPAQRLVEEEQWWIEYQAQMRKVRDNAAERGGVDQDTTGARDNVRVVEEVVEVVEETKWETPVAGGVEVLEEKWETFGDGHVTAEPKRGKWWRWGRK